MSARVAIESFGYLHGPPPKAHLTIDLRELLYNPHRDPEMRELTGLDSMVHDHVLSTNGASRMLWTTRRMVEALRCTLDPSVEPVRVAFGCAGGRHRSVVLAIELAGMLTSRGTSTEVLHRDIQRPVVTTGRAPLWV